MRCSICKTEKYCGTTCQKSAWKEHKGKCKAPLSLSEVWAKMVAAHNSQDWVKVLECTPHMEEMLSIETLTESAKIDILMMCSMGYRRRQECLGGMDDIVTMMSIETRRGDMFRNMSHFRDEGETWCFVGDLLSYMDDTDKAIKQYQKTRYIGEQHGFFILECISCMGLGKEFIKQGRVEEGLDLLRNARLAAPLCELDEDNLELQSIDVLTRALVDQHILDEAWALIPKFGELSRKKSPNTSNVDMTDINYLFTKARIHSARKEFSASMSILYDILERIQGNQETVRNYPTRYTSVMKDSLTHLKHLESRDVPVSFLMDSFTNTLAKHQSTYIEDPAMRVQPVPEWKDITALFNE
jgi:hypothetical protein